MFLCRVQQELRKELEDLQIADRKLVENREEAKKLQEIADRVIITHAFSLVLHGGQDIVFFDSSQDYQSAEEAISQWRGEIATLSKQAEASLAIMEEVASTLVCGLY